MTTPARPGSFTGATDNESTGGLFTDTLIDGIPDIVGADVASAQASATAAAASAGSAAASATAAAGSAVTATDASTSATDSASTASTDAGTATTKAGEAAESATTASEAAIAAAEDATAANESAGNAAGSETAAAASQTAASTSAGNALTSATAANTAKLAAEAALALFTDAYIGAYANDAAADTAAGAALTEGDLYFNTVTDQMKVCSAVNAGTGTWLTLTPTAANQANINIVANIETEVSEVAAIDTDVIKVANIDTDVTAVADIDTEVTAVAGDATDIGTVATDLAGSDTIGTVASQITPTNNIQAVATAAPDINTVATNLTGSNTIGTVASDLSGSNTIGAVATDIVEVNAVGADLTGSDTIGTVAADLSSTNTIGTVATNLTGSDTIGTVATNIDNVNLVGPDITNVNTVAGNIANVNTFANTYFVSATAPGSPTEGDLWFDTTANVMKVYNGIAWVAASSSVNGTAQRVNYTATAGQSTFNAIYDVGFVDVYLNGIKLIETTDFTATNGTSIVLTSPAAVDDTVDIVGYGLFELANFSINDANDVNTGGVTDGQALVFNSTSGDFEPQTPALTSGATFTGPLTASDTFTTGNGLANLVYSRINYASEQYATSTTTSGELTTTLGGNIHYCTADQTGNRTFNNKYLAFTPNGNISGISTTAAVLLTNGTTPYVINDVISEFGASYISTIDLKWQGGSAPTAGNANSVDLYTFTFIRTGDKAYTCFASQPIQYA